MSELKKYFIGILAASLLLANIGLAIGEEKIIFTPKSVDFYGYGDLLEVGDVITAYDPNEVLCGKFVVNTAGQYGMIHVYADDRTSKDVDEGAVEGDVITFYLNGTEVFPTNMKQAVWTKDGDRIRLDF